MRLRYMVVCMIVLFWALPVMANPGGQGAADEPVSDRTAAAGIAVKAGKVDGRTDFHLAVGMHYKVSEREIGLARKKKIKEDELPVLFHLSARAKVKPEAVMDLRVKGMSWAQITLHLGLGADIYYVPLKAHPGPPYGNAYGHFKKRKRSEWNKIVLADVDIVNLVNLSFMADHHGFSPDEVVKLRAGHRDCISFHADLKMKKRERHEAAERNKAAEKKKSGGKSGDGSRDENSGKGKGKHGDRIKDSDGGKHDDHGGRKGSKGKSGKKGRG